MKTTVEVSGARGTKIVKSTGMDSSSYSVKGATADQLKGGQVGGSRDNLSHSITSGKVPGGN
jgi:hypothetical protein